MDSKPETQERTVRDGSMSLLTQFETRESKIRRLLVPLKKMAAELIIGQKVVEDPTDENAYNVFPIVCHTKFLDGRWTCDCKRFKELKICEHSIASRMMEEQKTLIAIVSSELDNARALENGEGGDAGEETINQ